jgi:hypothetical protein
MKRTNIYQVLAVAGMILLAGFSPLSAATILGQIGTNGTSLDGHAVPSGTTLLGDSVVATGDHPAIVNLLNGRTVMLGGQSKVLFEIADAGLAIHVQAGTLAFSTSADEAVTLAANSVLMLNELGQVQEGTRVNRADVGICDLRNANTGEYFTDAADIALCHDKPGNDQCDWNRDDVPDPDLQGFLDHGAVRLGDSGTKLNSMCNSNGVGEVVVFGAKGGGGKKWALIAGAAVAGYLIYDDSQDDTVASPVTP